TQRSRVSRIAAQPSVGVSGRDGEGRFEQGDGARFERPDRVQSLPATPAKSHRTIERHEGDVRTEWGGDFHQMTAERRWRERIEAAKYGTGVGASAAEACPDRDPRVHLDREHSPPRR